MLARHLGVFRAGCPRARPKPANAALRNSNVLLRYSSNRLRDTAVVSGAGRGTGPAIINWGDMVVVVPEPGTCTLGLIFVVLVAIRRRRTR